ncbi:hypothetical protein BVRB_4g095990 [Beta vulgaris subsp. vulgaris]|nr:hypothetical protein BVRB_4g095990 [Beta vulgaris subsp. vulgaris]
MFKTASDLTNLMRFWTASDYFSNLLCAHLMRTKTAFVIPILTTSVGLFSTSESSDTLLS